MIYADTHLRCPGYPPSGKWNITWVAKANPLVPRCNISVGITQVEIAADILANSIKMVTCPIANNWVRLAGGRNRNSNVSKAGCIVQFKQEQRRTAAEDTDRIDGRRYRCCGKGRGGCEGRGVSWCIRWGKGWRIGRRWSECGRGG